MSYTFRIIIEKEGKNFHGYVPTLSGCHTFGKTIEETQKNLKDVIRVYVESIIAEKWKVPHDAIFESFQTITLSKEYA
jgi:predicted RNase H-like HicB family nuclease